MKSIFKDLIFTQPQKDSFVVFLGTLTNVISGGLFFIIVPRLLTPPDYGLFSTVLATALIAVALANFGIDSGILRFASPLNKRFNQVISLALKSYLMLGLAVTVLGIVLSGTIADFFNQPSLVLLLRIAFSSVLLFLLTNFYIAALQAKKEYLKASIVSISSNFARLLLVVVSVYFLSVNLLLLTAIFFFVPLISIIFGRFYFPFQLKNSSGESLKFHKYNLWIAASLVISQIPIDNYFLLKLAGPAQVGLYFAPFKLLTVCYQFGGNFTRVLASRFASFNEDKKAISFAKKSALVPMMFVLGLVFLMPLAPIISKIFGSQYQGLGQIFSILTLGFIFFFLATIPSTIITYYFGKTQISFIITVARYALFTFLLMLLVPTAQAVGAAISFSVSELFSFLAMTFYVIYKFAKHQ